jgi:hypothetical protein
VFTTWLTLFSDLAAAQLSANEIVARRMMGFAVSNANGTLAADPELTRMVTEKWSAAFEGATAVSTTMLTLAARPDTMIEATAALTRAATAPAMRQLKINNRRLRRPKP